MTIRPADLRSIPIFREITDEHLTTLMGVFERQVFPAGETLFTAGSMPTKFLLLARGEVSLEPGPAPGDPAPESLERGFRLRAIAPIGELGALTSVPRNTTAVTATEAEIWSVDVFSLMAFFERNGDVAFPFYHNFLKVISDKVGRDRRRMDEMRANIVRTQKAMKRLRDLVLESGETDISKPAFELLDELIEKNRRAHYRVSPTGTMPAGVRLDDGTALPVLDISDTHVKLVGTSELFAEGSTCSFVLLLPPHEIPLSGTVERAARDGAVVKLDLLIPDYKAVLDDYITRLQMLDYVV